MLKKYNKLKNKNISGKIGLFLIFSIIFAFISACSSPTNSQTGNNQKTTIVTSFYPMYIFTLNIAKNIPNVEVVNLTEPQTGCLHDYQLSTSDMKTLEKADIFIINGAGMESFLDKVIKQFPNLKTIEASKGIDLIKSEFGHDHKNEHENKNENDKNNNKNNDKNDNNTSNNSSENHEEEYNPHVWVSITNAIQQIKNITEELCNIDHSNADAYKNNADEYVNSLTSVKEKMLSTIKSLKNLNIVTFHEAFPYFAKEFGLNIVGVVESEPGQEPSSEEIKNLIKVIKDKNVKSLFTEEQYSPKIAETIANETGCKIYKLDLIVTGPKNPDLSYYEKAMENNLAVLQEALK